MRAASFLLAVAAEVVVVHAPTCACARPPDAIALGIVAVFYLLFVGGFFGFLFGIRFLRVESAEE